MARKRRRIAEWRLPNPRVLGQMDAESLCGLLSRSLPPQPEIGLGDAPPPTPEAPAALAAAIRATGAAATPHLLALVRDREGWWSEVYTGCHTARAAAALLSEIGDDAALPGMLDAMIETAGVNDWSALCEALKAALIHWGAPALEPTLAAWKRADVEAETEAVIEVLAGLQIPDMRVRFLLLEQLREAPELGADNMRRYGHPEGCLEALQEALEGLEIHPAESDESDVTFLAIVDAIWSLDGVLDDAQSARLEAVQAAERSRSRRLVAEVEQLQIEREAYRRALDQTRSSVGRNEACWCGSGEKYKRCHWAIDRQSGDEA